MSRPLNTDIARIDPAQAWQHWAPDAGDPWGPRLAGHLLRRAAFGARPEGLADAVRVGHDKAIARLLAGEPGHEKNDDLLADMGARFGEAGDVARLRGWWLYAMLHSGHPLREKLALFWHNHFATSIAKVKSPRLMFRQNQLIRTHALGDFKAFLKDMGRDVAMLLWLDSNQNVKGRPNENYAREVMELFTLGVGNYTEKDVQEAARCFTGWHTDDELNAFAFNKDAHDAGDKTVLGRTGPWDGDTLLPVLLARPACADFLAAKLYAEFISDTPPPRGLLAPLAAKLRSSGYKIADAVALILRSRLFFSEHAFLRRVKSPVEFVLGAVQATWPGPSGTAEFVEPLGKMGQSLFAPPNVKGWPGGRAWLNTSTLLARNNFADRLTMGVPERRVGRGPDDIPPEAFDPDPPPPPGETPLPRFREPMAELLPPPYEPKDPPAAFDVAARFKTLDPTKPTDIADGLLEALLPGCAPAATRKAIAAFILEGEPTGADLRHRIREAAHAVLCSADYHLC